MRSLQLANNYCLYGLSKEEYDKACEYIEFNITSTSDEDKEANAILFKAHFKFDLSTIVGDTDLSKGNISLPEKVAMQIFDSVKHGDKTSYQCFGSSHWRDCSTLIIHEDIRSSVQCAIEHLGKPFAFIITKTPKK